ncbi:CPBP family glutamic-type intramembrane protease [Pedobacter paludis]|uniref:CAAX prenyl protease 2/Lysostaphin resistance protein A-like domain-containing protein n=1 Tax=Pedobacter paludis TaxID=2203212 RepID=A0A317EZ64_9SPHI|nr:CPBP family glutamic-type intramembrane protease [Pedobacter paludis]PWS31795.1 hypothetical protein DF947_08325 [Pedobacter paludis]
MLYDFFKNPNIQFKQSKSFKDSLKDLFSVFGYAFLCVALNYLIVSFIDFIITSTKHFSFITAIDKAQNVASTEKNILFFLVIAPVIEELIFRLPLKASRLNIFISFILAYYLFYLSHKTFQSIVNINESIKFLTFSLICYSLLYKVNTKFYYTFSGKYFTAYFYLLTITFGLLHLSNFIHLVPDNLILFAPIFVIHQIIVGFFLGYLRLKRGLFWSILMHTMLNVLPTIGYFIKK